MSGIYGFSCRIEDHAPAAEILGGMEYWNRIYGRDASGQERYDHAGMGCHIEHFSDRFPCGAPILSFNGGAAVIDALLFNREELEHQLGLAALCSLSDEELLLKLIEECGYDALAQVNGDFSGAIYRPETGEWILFRDHLGVRPLYYYLSDSMFLFSTDIRSIASVEGVDTQVNREKLFARFNFGNPLSMQQTDFAYIRCILPGAVTRVIPGKNRFILREKPYWRLRSRKIRLGDDAAYARRMRELVEDSVRRRMDAVPGLIGAELSGGLDSSVIDILINRNGRQGCYFSWSPDPEFHPLAEGEDERKVIRDICRQEGIECQYLYQRDTRCTWGMYDRVVPSFVNTLELSYGSRRMRQLGARVIFTGHGGDEGVSHRGSRFELFCSGELRSYFRFYLHDLKGRPFRVLKALYNCLFDTIKQIPSVMHEPYRRDILSSVLDCRFAAHMSRTNWIEPLYFRAKPYRYVLQGGTRDRLDNVAFQGASAGVRYLLPFVDHRVMDFAVSVPRRLHITPEGNRMLYREAFQDLMPPSLSGIRYKAFLSMKTVDLPEPDPVLKQQEREKERDFFLERLDPEYWQGILDMEAIARREPPKDAPRMKERAFIYDTHELYRCILIQNTAKLAKEWRTIDEKHDLL